MMKLSFLLTIIVVTSFVLLQPERSAAQPPIFTYQGRLNDGLLPANGTYQMQFSLWSAPSGPSQVGATITTGAITVTNGTFTVQLAFAAPNAFDGSLRWLEIAVRKSSDPPGFTTLAPRQLMTSSPYAIRSTEAASADALTCLSCVSDGHIFSISGTKVTGTVANATNAVNATNATNATTATTAGNVTGIVQIANGGTGSATKNFVDTTTAQTNIGGDKTFTGRIGVTGAGMFIGDGSGLTDVPGTFRWQSVSVVSQQAQPNTGYLANNGAQVTITLPASPGIGDVIRVSGMGTGGWKIAQNAGQSILGANIDMSGTIWKAREAFRPWQSIASSADGTKLAAVAHGWPIYTSTDSGVNWTPRDINRQWQSIASSADGTKLAAVVNGGQIYTSTDSGVTWTARATSQPWQSIASSANGTKLVAVHNSGTGGEIFTSTDSGVTWTSPFAPGQWLAVTSSADGTKLAATTSGQLCTSTDSGVTWTLRPGGGGSRSIASSADGTKLAAVDDNEQIHTSTDSGVTWTLRESDRQWRSIASSADGSRLAAVVFGGQIYISKDSGVTWTPRESIRDWQAVASSADGTKLAAAGNLTQIYTSWPVTTTGTAGFLTGGQFSVIELVFIGNGQFMPLSHSGAIQGF